MRAFEDYSVVWKEKTYTIRGNRLLVVIAAVEEIITLKELCDRCEQNKPPLARIATAYATILGHAGASVSDREVYEAIFQGEAAVGDMDNAVNGILGLMVPPELMAKLLEAPGKPRKAGKRSSRKSTRRRSGRAG